MYFTDNKKRFEHDMKIVPNFERKEVWEYADSCKECRNCKSSLLNKLKNRNKIKERMTVPTASAYFLLATGDFA